MKRREIVPEYALSDDHRVEQRAGLAGIAPVVLQPFDDCQLPSYAAGARRNVALGHDNSPSEAGHETLCALSVWITISNPRHRQNQR